MSSKIQEGAAVRAMLEQAIAQGGNPQVDILYRDKSFNYTQRTIIPRSIDGRTVKAVCLLRGRVKNFSIDGIMQASVQPQTLRPSDDGFALPGRVRVDPVTVTLNRGVDLDDEFPEHASRHGGTLTRTGVRAQLAGVFSGQELAAVLTELAPLVAGAADLTVAGVDPDTPAVSLWIDRQGVHHDEHGLLELDGCGSYARWMH